jgi:antitoxin HigA-1
MSKQGLSARLYAPYQTLNMVNARLPKKNLVRQSAAASRETDCGGAFLRLTYIVNLNSRDRGLSLSGNRAMARPAIHPGEILADELSELKITPTELSRQISVPPNRISQIIQGKRAITGDTALRLGHWFQTSAQFWLNLQSAYDLRVANEEIGREVAALPTRLTMRRAGA